jgi:hypothetical protein
MDPIRRIELEFAAVLTMLLACMLVVWWAFE